MATLAELRTEVGLRQADIADAMWTTQSAVSRMERQGDLLLSTLRSYVTAIGGSLRIVVSLNAREAELDLGDPS